VSILHFVEKKDNPPVERKNNHLAERKNNHLAEKKDNPPVERKDNHLVERKDNHSVDTLGRRDNHPVSGIHLPGFVVVVLEVVHQTMEGHTEGIQRMKEVGHGLAMGLINWMVVDYDP
jgi:hypothetical protein